MNNVTINFNNENYLAKYNKQTGYFEVDINSPNKGGLFKAKVNTTDLIGRTLEEEISIQIFAKEKIEFETNKIFMWIFDYNDFSVKDIVEIADYEINIDEETNSKTIINVLKKTTAKARDLIAIKKNNKVIYWGIVDNIQNADGQLVYEYTLKYITNIFNQKVILNNEELIKTTGIEDFIASAIKDNFTENEDTFVNISYLQLDIKSHTKKQTSVTNVENGIYNLHTWMTNCTQSYDIVYSFSINNKKLIMTIELKEEGKELIDVKAQAISNYVEVFETDVVSKVIVKYDKVAGEDQKGEYTLYLLNDRTTTTDVNNKNRAIGKIETVYTTNFEDAQQLALNTIKSNTYNHNITFSIYNKFFKIGTPIAIKTKESVILDTYISAIKISQNKFIEYTCGNIRINFIDKILKERGN